MFILLSLLVPWLCVITKGCYQLGRSIHPPHPIHSIHQSTPPHPPSPNPGGLFYFWPNIWRSSAGEAILSADGTVAFFGLLCARWGRGSLIKTQDIRSFFFVRFVISLLNILIPSPQSNLTTSTPGNEQKTTTTSLPQTTHILVAISPWTNASRVVLIPSSFISVYSPSLHHTIYNLS